MKILLETSFLKHFKRYFLAFCDLKQSQEVMAQKNKNLDKADQEKLRQKNPKYLKKRTS